MGLKKASDIMPRYEIDNALIKTQKEQTDEIIERIQANPKYRKYVYGIVLRDVRSDEEKERILRDLNNLIPLKNFLDFHDTHKDWNSWIGKKAYAPFLRLSSDLRFIETVLRYSEKESERREAFRQFKVCDGNSVASIVTAGDEQLSLPSGTRGNEGMWSAMEGRLSLFLEGGHAKGMLFIGNDPSTGKALDTVATLSAHEKKTVAVLSGWSVFADLASHALTLEARESAYQCLKSAQWADVLCLYGLGAMPTNKPFLETVLIPFLSQRNRQGKITFAGISPAKLGSLMGFSSKEEAVLSFFSGCINDLMDSCVIGEKETSPSKDDDIAEM